MRTVSQHAPNVDGRLDALGALGDPTRRAIFLQLTKGSRAVGELARDLPVGRPAVSQHLKVLKDVGLVTLRQDGTRHRYEISRDGVAGLRSWLDGVWDQALDAFKAAAEQTDQ